MTETCFHCGQPIKYHSIYGWYHGDMSGGWNTSCESDETRASPFDQYLED